MSARLPILLGAVLLVSPATTSAADDPAAIVEKAIKAAGGEEKLAKTKAEQWKAKGTIAMMGMKMTYSADYFFQKPGQMRFDIAVDIGEMKMNFTAATDGKVAWEKMGDMLQEMEAKKGKAFHDQVYTMHLCGVLPLKDKDYTLAMADEIKIDGKEAIGVKVTKKGQRDVTLYFDKKTGLLAKCASTVWDEFTDKEVSQEAFIMDWKEKDGMKHFGKLVIKRDGKDFITEEFSDQKSVDKFDAKTFAKP
jgi:hypothetical protein